MISGAVDVESLRFFAGPPCSSGSKCEVLFADVDSGLAEAIANGLVMGAAAVFRNRFTRRSTRCLVLRDFSLESWATNGRVACVADDVNELWIFAGEEGLVDAIVGVCVCS